MHSLTSGAGNDGRLGIVTTESFLPEKYKQKTFCRLSLLCMFLTQTFKNHHQHHKMSIINIVFILRYKRCDPDSVTSVQNVQMLRISSGILRSFSNFNKSSNYAFSRVCLSVCHSVSSRVSSCDRDLSKLSLEDRPLLSHTLGSPTPPDRLVSGWLGISRHIWSSF